MVVKVYISVGEFSQISIEFLEMLFTFSNLIGSSSSSSSSNASSYFSFSGYSSSSGFTYSGYSSSSNSDLRVLRGLLSVFVFLIIFFIKIAF